MGLNHLAITLLTGLSALLGVSSLPKVASPDWILTQNWIHDGQYYRIEAVSKTLPGWCRVHPGARIVFPSIIQGAQQVFLDSKLIDQFGDPTFRSVRTFYGAPEVSCDIISGGQILKWKAYSYTRYFARVPFYPQTSKSTIGVNFFAETLNVIAAGTLLVMALISFLLFFGRIPNFLTISLGLANLCLSLYFAGGSAGLLGIRGSMLALHKLADLGAWVGMAFFFNALRLKGLVGPKTYLAFAVNVAVACLIIATGETGDTIQLGTTLPFGFLVALNLICGYRLWCQSIASGVRRNQLFAALSLSVFLVAAINEILVVTGIVSNGYTVFNLGCIGGLLFFALFVNEQISVVYREVAVLNRSLQQKVEERTVELKQKYSELAETHEQLKRAQADLIQSEKLASLGTLSAGIAHEINNSLNYVSGAISPLKKIASNLPDERAKDKLLKLTDVISEGLDLTFSIMNSLRTYTGLNQAKFTDINLGEVIRSVLVLIKGRLGEGIAVEVDVPLGLTLSGHIVGLQQAFMNLIVNAADAMGGKGKLRISARDEGDRIELECQDTGCGIPEQNLGKIFDPFFTTKEVGKGSGLGLHIIKNEVERHNGAIQVRSKIGVGTTFTIQLPKMAPESRTRVA